jgi:hypothetical protein
MLPVAAALVDKLYAPADVHAPPDVWRHPVQPDVLPRGAVDGHWKHGSTEAIRRHGSPCGSSPSLQSFAHQGGLAMTQGRSPASPCATYPNVEKPLVTSTSHMLSRYISLSVINSSLSEDVLSTVVGAASARDAWTTLEKSYASRSKARIMQIRMQLSTIQKKDLCIAEYFRKVKRLVDTLAAIGKRLEDEELITYMLRGLGPNYDPLITSITTRTDSYTVSDVYAHMLNFEMRQELNNLALGHMSSANAAGRSPGHGGGSFGYASRGRGRGNGGRGNGGRSR